MCRRTDTLRLSQPAIAESKTGGDEAVEKDDFDPDRDRQTDVPFHIGGCPTAAAEPQKQEPDRDDEIALDERDEKVDRDYDVRNDDEESGEGKRRHQSE